MKTNFITINEMINMTRFLRYVKFFFFSSRGITLVHSQLSPRFLFQGRKKQRFRFIAGVG